MADILHMASINAKNYSANLANRKNVFFIKRVYNSLSANRQAKRIMKAINEAEQIHAGKRQGKSFHQLFKEI